MQRLNTWGRSSKVTRSPLSVAWIYRRPMGRWVRVAAGHSRAELRKVLGRFTGARWGETKILPDGVNPNAAPVEDLADGPEIAADVFEED
jgi:hypothetical protein